MNIGPDSGTLYMQIRQNNIRLFDASKKKVGIVVSRFNESVTSALLNQSLHVLKEFKVKEKAIEVVSVAGAVEIPFALQLLARSKKYDCLVALGCVIHGETPHFDYVCKMVSEGVLRVSLDYRIPIGFGILTLNSLKQAKARIHVGGDAVAAALELSNL